LHRLTNIAGSSDYVLGGVVSYSNEIKEAILGVPHAILIEHGAVSEQTARAMVTGVRAMFGTDIAVSVTGIAGPGGATETKPVGLVYIALAGPDGLLKVQRYLWEFDREGNKEASAEAALKLILETYSQ
jgi:PncC family amidohydrolase